MLCSFLDTVMQYSELQNDKMAYDHSLTRSLTFSLELLDLCPQSPCVLLNLRRLRGVQRRGWVEALSQVGMHGHRIKAVFSLRFSINRDQGYERGIVRCLKMAR